MLQEAEADWVDKLLLLLVPEKDTSLVLKRKVQWVANPKKFTCVEGMVWMIGVCYHLTSPWTLTAFLRMFYEKGRKYCDR